MRNTLTVREVLAVPFAALRVPLALVDHSVRRLLPMRSRPRTAFDHGLGVLDHWAGLILDDEGIAHSGRVRIANAGVFRPETVPQLPAPARSTTYATTRIAAPAAVAPGPAS